MVVSISQPNRACKLKNQNYQKYVYHSSLFCHNNNNHQIRILCKPWLFKMIHVDFFSQLYYMYMVSTTNFYIFNDVNNKFPFH